MMRWRGAIWPAIGCLVIVSLSTIMVGEVGGEGKESSLVNWFLECCQKRLACREAVREWMAAVAVSIENLRGRRRELPGNIGRGW